jgi:hypothetical protein
MPQFVARPVLIEAHQYQGHTLNMDGPFNAAFLSYVSGSTARVWNEGVPCELHVGDWLVRGRDGVVRVCRQAVFETNYHQPEPEAIKRGPGRPPKVHQENAHV